MSLNSKSPNSKPPNSRTRRFALQKRVQSVVRLLAALSLWLVIGCHPKPSHDTGANSKPDAGAVKQEPPACVGCSSAQVCIEGVCKESGSPVLGLPIGAGAQAIAVAEQMEANTLGPTSFAVRGSHFALLDTENQQLKLFHNSTLEGQVPLDSGTYEDVVFFDDDRFALLDRAGEGSVVLMRRDGSVQTRAPLSSTGVGELGHVGKLARRATGVWVEYRSWMVRFLLPDGSEDTARSSSQAYLMADDQHQLYTRVTEHTVSFEKLASSSSFVTKDHEFDTPLFPWWTLDTDSQGKTYLLLGIGDGEDYAPYIHVFNSDLSLDRVVPFPGISPTDSPMRTFVVSAEGDIYHLVREGNDVQIIKH